MPFWDDHSLNLYLVNFITQSANETALFRYSFVDGRFYSATLRGRTSPSFIVPISENCATCKDLFVVGVMHDVVIVRWDGVSPQAEVVNTIFSVETDNDLSRLDIARPDSSGRLYFGTFSNKICGDDPKYSLYRYDKARGVVRLFGSIKTTGGLVFDEKAKLMYHMDTCSAIITAFDYDPKTGDICKCV